MTPDNPTPVPDTNKDRRIARVVFVFLVVVILAGFGKNFYLRRWIGTRTLTPAAWLHGLCMSAWLIMFVIQVLLVARRRVDLHRKLGFYGAVLAILIIPIGVLTIIVRARLTLPSAPLAPYAVLFVAFDGLNLLLFGALVGSALHWRPCPAVHRRLMTMAMISLLPPAFGRLIAYATRNDIELTVLGLMSLTVLICVAIDGVRSSHLHRASYVPGLLIVLTNGVTCIAQLVS